MSTPPGGRIIITMMTGGACHLVKHVATFTVFSRLTPTGGSRTFIGGALGRAVDHCSPTDTETLKTGEVRDSCE